MQTLHTSTLRKNPIRTAEKKILDTVYKPLVKWYTGRERPYTYRNIPITVLPGVFHPGLFYSTRFLLEYLEFVNMQRLHVLELGAGSGLISVKAAIEGAYVTATDINLTAVMNIRINRDRNLSKIIKNDGTLEVIQSDLFQKLAAYRYDVIVINPPYYRGKISIPEDYAWYCGEEFEYFKNLFEGLSSYMHNETEAIMILSDDCDLKTIQKIASDKGLELKLKLTRRNLIEKNFIFQIQKLA
ncbi:MAG: methyltransferase [Bacteroidetes bacterium]|nr:methyltransferase [Bacteroidota bacterium]